MRKIVYIFSILGHLYLHSMEETFYSFEKEVSLDSKTVEKAGIEWAVLENIKTSNNSYQKQSDLDLLLNVFNNYKEEDLAVEKNQKKKIVQKIDVNIDNSFWSLLPIEIKSYIFLFIPEEIGHLILINKESYDLTQDLFFLKSFAKFIINKNLKKAVGLYSLAYEKNHINLFEALLQNNLKEEVIKQYELKITFKEFDSTIAKSTNHEIKNFQILFIKALVSLYQREALILLCASSQRGDLNLYALLMLNNVMGNLIIKRES